jgi:ABC-type dipeptide/oligopeptide/nickel transport system ATPase component
MSGTDPVEPLLRVRDLGVSFSTEHGEVRAVDGISFEIHPGEILGIVGESGSGKTVGVMSLLRLIPSPPGRITGGEAWFAGRDLLKLSLPELRQVRGREIGVIFQEPMTALSPLHPIGRQLTEVMRVHGVGNPDEQRALALEWLDKVGIANPAERFDDLPHQFSGGMRQRVMIAMALLLQPRLIIADEPTTALDVTVQAQIFDLMLGIKGGQTAMALITHDMGAVWEMCDRMIVMLKGRVVEEGPVESVIQNPQHPYTRALIQSVPPLDRKLDRLPATEEFLA